LSFGFAATAVVYGTLTSDPFTDIDLANTIAGLGLGFGLANYGQKPFTAKGHSRPHVAPSHRRRCRWVRPFWRCPLPPGHHWHHFL